MIISNFNIKVIDNFLNNEDYEELVNLKLKNIKKDQIRVYHNSINNNNEIKNESISKDLILKIHKRYHNRVFNILEELNPEKAKLYDYTDLVLIETGANYEFPIHDDTPNKLLSGVIYIKPEKNSGTCFYKNKSGKEKKSIEWRTNRGVFFSRQERTTWHSYSGNGISNRFALVYNLNTNRLKEVYKIENKSYLLGRLRYKLNPHLYHFFKFMI